SDGAARIHALEVKPLELPADPLKIPPWDAVLSADHDRVGTEERPKSRRQRRQAVRLDAEEHDVGPADRPQIAGDARLDLEVAVGAQHAQAALRHGLQMWTSSEEHDLDTRVRRSGQARTDIAADRPGAGNDDLHNFTEPSKRPSRRRRVGSFR